MTARAVRRIESEENRVFKHLAKVLTGRGMRKYDAAIVSGARIVSDVLRTSPELCEAWIATPRQPPPPPAVPARAAWYQLSPSLFRKLDVSGTDAPLLLVSTPHLAPWRPGDELPRGCTLLVPFQDPDNVGAVIRSAAAFGVAQVVLLAESAHPYHPKALRASSGAVLTTALRRGPSIRDLPADLPVVALSSEGSDIRAFSFPDRFVLLPGIEGPGLPERLRARALSIPMTDAVESLNAAAATAVALYAWAQSRA